MDFLDRFLPPDPVSRISAFRVLQLLYNQTAKKSLFFGFISCKQKFSPHLLHWLHNVIQPAALKVLVLQPDPEVLPPRCLNTDSLTPMDPTGPTAGRILLLCNGEEHICCIYIQKHFHKETCKIIFNSA